MGKSSESNTNRDERGEEVERKCESGTKCKRCCRGGGWYEEAIKGPTNTIECERKQVEKEESGMKGGGERKKRRWLIKDVVKRLDERMTVAINLIGRRRSKRISLAQNQSWSVPEKDDVIKLRPCRSKRKQRQAQNEQKNRAAWSNFNERITESGKRAGAGRSGQKQKKRPKIPKMYVWIEEDKEEEKKRKMVAGN